MRHRLFISNSKRAPEARRAAFTLIEVLLALSLFMVLLAVIFVPLNNAFQVFNAGRTSIALQGAADSTVKAIAADLQGAVAVFPNDNMPGITDRLPYSSVSGISRPPYFSNSACTIESARVANVSRIDFVLPTRNTDGAISNPVKSQPFLVSYYARRFKAYSTPTDAFDPYSNPIGLYRAQMPYLNNSDNPLVTTDDVLFTDDTRYSGCTAAKSKWLVQSAKVTDVKPAEPELASSVGDTTDGVPGGDTLVSPRDMGISVLDTTTMQPDLSFQCEDTDSNGIIDRVTISLTLVQYEEGNSGTNGQPAGQRVTATQVVNLPNTKFGV